MSDEEAKHIATTALMRIDRHEAVCAERYEGIKLASIDVRNSIKSLETRLWTAAVTVIGMELAVLAFFLAPFFAPKA